MRALILLFAIGCGPDVDGHSHFKDAGIDTTQIVDGPRGPDADLYFCDATADSAHVTVTDASTTTTYSRVHLATVLGGGPFAPTSAVQISLQMMFTDADHIGTNDAFDCLAPDYAHCPVTGALVPFAAVDGVDPGTYPVAFESLNHAGLDAHGVLTINQIVLPTTAPGHVKGSVTTTSGADAVNGTFENDICLVSVPI
ncbi:MAG: hypothetical protein ABI678_32710 [Kofleriaceae bacterium]